MLSRWLALPLCATFLVLFGITAWLSIRQKCATYDEPMHGMGAYMLSQYGDFRINPEDPPLWEWWASLPISHHELKVDIQHPLYKTILGVQAARWPWAFKSLYMTPGNDADSFISKMRAMLILLGVALGAVIGWWAWRLSGATAATIAVALFSLDPNFLAHSAVIKNDVAISLVGTALAFAAWCAGRHLTRVNALCVVFLGAAAVVTKFSGPLLLIALAATLAVRVVMPGPWRIGMKAVHTLLGRAGVAGALLLLTGLTAFFAIWACYLFRYAPAVDGQPWDFEVNVRGTHIKEIAATHPDQQTITPDELEYATQHPKPIVRALTFIDDHHLLPQTWTYGMLYVYRSSRLRTSYLMGQLSQLGFRWYFPLAFLFKTPLATLGSFALAIAVGVAGVVGWRRRCASGVTASAPSLWSIACVAVPFVLYALVDLRATLNIGLRHILPLYPFLFIAIGCALAKVWHHWGGNGRVLVIGLGIALLIETGSAFPDYLPFFNRAAGGQRGGLALLGDSNLDWGQDLPSLARWQREHQDRKLYLLYFGSADPTYYGIKYSPLPGFQSQRTDIPPVDRMPTEPGVMAISATYLQGIYLPKELRKIYGVLRDQPPLDVLGGSIYLYEYNP